MEKIFPEGMVPLESSPFTFSCHPGVACFTQCCKNVDMQLFPYDILRLRQAVKLDSEKFLYQHSRVISGDNPYFPAVMLKLDEKGWCPFLSSDGCTVYSDRPSACRTYPLERAIDRKPNAGRQSEFYFMTNHDYCMGHKEEQNLTVKQWVRQQRLEQFNLMNDLWGEIDTLFSTNPWKGEGVGGEKQRFAFMVCYDIDGFRGFVEQKNVLQQFRIDKDLKRRILSEDSELLKFGFEWLKLIFSGNSSLIKRQ